MRSTATIVFKSGATIEVDVKEMKTGRNKISGELTTVEWLHHENASRRILTLTLENIDAIVFNDGGEED